MSENNSFVRKEMISERVPPAAERGLVKWVRENLFSSAFNTIMTFISLWVIYSIIVAVTPWFLNGVWDAKTVRECYDLLDGKSGACFAVLKERFPQLIYGFKYPSSEYWRPNLATALLLVALAPILFRRLPRQLLIFSAIYPFLAFWLIWGGSILTSVSAFLGCALAIICYRRFSSGSFAIAVLVSLIAANVWWIIALNIRSWRGSLLNKIGAKATRSNTVAKFGLQYSDDGYLKP